MQRHELQQLIERFGGKPIALRTIERADPATWSDKDTSVEAVLTTEAPADVWDWERWDVVPEILRMDGMVLPQGRDQVPLLDTHSRWSIADQLGSVRSFGDSSVSGYAAKTARFFFASTKDAQDAATKVKEGHVTDNSVGYEVLASTWIAPGASVEIGGKTYNGGERGLRVTTQWKLKEVSLCPIGADELATIRSEHTRGKRADDTCPECGEAVGAEDDYCSKCGKKIERSARDKPAPAAIPAKEHDEKQTIHIHNTRGGVETMADETKNQLTEAEKAQARADEVARIKSITEYGKRFVGKIENVDDLVEKAITGNASIELFKGTLADRMAEKGKSLETPVSQLDLSEKDQKRYSITRAIGAQLAQRGIGEFKGIDDKFERECSEEIAKRTESTPKGIFIPYEMQPGRMTAERALLAMLSKRDQTVGSATAGGNLVGTNLLANEFIEYPRNMFLADKIGVRVLSGLVGNIAMPKQTGAGTVSWVGESTAGAETAITVGQVTLSLKSITAFYDYSRKLLLQSTPGIDRLIAEDGDTIIRLGIDKAIFHGSGGDQPTGIAGTSGVGTVNAAGLGWAQAVEFRTDVAAANLLASGMAFVTDPVTYGVLMTREKATGYPVYLLEDGKLVNYPVYDSNQINANHIFFGSGPQVLLGEWGVLDVLADPFTASTKGDIRVVFYKSVDVAVRHAGAWTYASDAD